MGQRPGVSQGLLQLVCIALCVAVAVGVLVFVLLRVTRSEYAPPPPLGEPDRPVDPGSFEDPLREQLIMDVVAFVDHD